MEILRKGIVVGRMTIVLVLALGTNAKIPQPSTFAMDHHVCKGMLEWRTTTWHKAIAASTPMIACTDARKKYVRKVVWAQFVRERQQHPPLRKLVNLNKPQCPLER
jgi:hypothetical protein